LMPMPDFTFAAYGFGLLAGILSILSPCVLPLLPIVLGSALATHRYGAVALSLGLALSFVIVGLFVATIGFSLGLDGEVFRRIGAVLLLVFGGLMLFPGLQARATALLAYLPGTGLGARLQQGAQVYRPAGIGGQLMLGLLLGVVWSPCVGPTLGAAATLAAQRQNLGSVAAMMLVFGIGASLPLLAIGLGLGYWRDRAGAGGAAETTPDTWRRAGLIAGRFGKILLGGLLVLLGLLILSGHDREIEVQMVDWSPAWLTTLTTRF
ncbi:MAG TPA: cytochrome c biogenesis protein CcdA, partial [Dongiaceae bacterium]|nr:cytochrome c biogenesis protein CcdA [Dongiaceae bacterium]